MCGIIGIMSNRRIAPEEAQAAVTSLRHRGPDAEAIYFNDVGTLALGHTRLSIIDLSQQANQPMKSSDGRFVIVFNGEIYNFKEVRKLIKSINGGIDFITNSDTEVILQAFSMWGPDMVNHLEGMFAIAIFDVFQKKIFLFRDRVGKKPLYYFSNHEIFIFGSEIKALLTNPAVQASRAIDTKAIHEFLHLGYVPEPRTIFRQIKKFPAGYIGEVGADFSLKLKQYWRPEDYLPSVGKAEGAASTFRTLLESAVQKRLISDVPVGTFLSGGTDSSLITAIASKFTSGKLKTFSIGFKESAFDEQRFAEQVAAQLNTDHHAFVLAEQEAATILEKYINHFDEPFADTSAIPTMLVSGLARKEVKVALTGDGGDELFQGYGSYVWAQRMGNPLLKLFREPIAFGLRLSENSRLKRVSHLLEGATKNGMRSHIFSQEQYFFSAKEIENNLLCYPNDYTPFCYQDPIVASRHLCNAELQAFFDLKFYLKDDLLVKVDRASMYHSLECRSPLLDQSIIEFALGLPFELKRNGKVSKWILKELLKDYLPKPLVHRPKWGFSIPLSRWLKNEFHYLIDDYLNTKLVEETGIVKVAYVNQLKASFMKGEDYLYNRIWVLIVLHKWLKENA